MQPPYAQPHYMPYISHSVEYQTGALIQKPLQVSYIHRDLLKRVCD